MILEKANEKLCWKIECLAEIGRPDRGGHADQIMSPEKIAEAVPRQIGLKCFARA